MFTGLGGEKLWLCPTLTQNSTQDITSSGLTITTTGSVSVTVDTGAGGTHANFCQGNGTNQAGHEVVIDNFGNTYAEATSVSWWSRRTAGATVIEFGGGANFWPSVTNFRFFYQRWNTGQDLAYMYNTSGGTNGWIYETGSNATWKHHVMVREGVGGKNRLYINGVLDTEEYDDGGAETTGKDMYLGIGGGSSPDSELYMDDMRTYGRVLTQAEIAHLASSRGVQGGPYYKPLTLKSRVTRLLSNRAATLLERIRSASKPTTPISIKVKHNEEPSYKAGYAKNADESENPHLWKGLVGAWMPSLGVTGDTLRDVSGNGNDGTLTNMDAASDWVATSKGWALDFDGSGEHVNCGDILNEEIDNSLTMTCFCKPAVFGGFQNIFSKPFLYWLHQEQGVNRFRFKVRATSGVQYVQADVPITLGQTYFLTGVMSKNTLEIYVDGKFYASQSFVGSLDRSSIYDLKIGGWIGTNDDFTGSIGNASIYNRALSPQEIQELYVDSLAPFRRKKSAIGYQPIKELKGLIRT